MAKQMKKKKTGAARPLTSAISLVIVLVLILATSLVALNGVGKGAWITYMKPWAEAISLGLDLRGGVFAVYQAKQPEEGNFETLLAGTLGVLESRLTGQGFTEATVTQQGSDRIRIEIPDVKDPDEIINIIGTPAHLEFKDSAGNVVMEGKHVKLAVATNQSGYGNMVVSFQLTDEGRDLFAKATAENLGKTISIELDGQVISAPTVNSVISNGAGIIESSSMSNAEAQNLAMLIQSGALPLSIEQIEVSAISASLGVEALDRALQAGLIGTILVMLFMLLRYRLPGLVADLALTIYILLVLFLLAVTGAQLTLPGIAGIILGIGMAVDANVVIFERFREEVRNGRTLRPAVTAGFKNALSAIVDSNVTTMIAALVLLQFGTGSIKGFAITLLISVAASMFTGVVVTRALLKLFVNLGIKNTKLYVA